MTDRFAGQAFVGAKVMLFLGDDLLALRRDHTPGIPFPGCLDFPGGGREGHETPVACALRETYEETGLRLARDDLILAHVREGDGGSWFFAAHQPAERTREVRFGGEGAGWQMMPPEAFVAAPDAVPHFRDILRAYLEEKKAGKRRAGRSAELPGPEA